MAPPGEMPSNNLWVGNLTPDVTEADLTGLFQKYGPVDSVTSYSARGFAFLYFKNINDAKEAKDALQGSFFHGNPLRIEFAKPVCFFVFMFNQMDFCCFFIDVYKFIFVSICRQRLCVPDHLQEALKPFPSLKNQNKR